MTETILIKTVGNYEIRKKEASPVGDKKYVVSERESHASPEEFSNLRKAERFAERMLGIRDDGRDLRDAGLCCS